MPADLSFPRPRTAAVAAAAAVPGAAALAAVAFTRSGTGTAVGLAGPGALTDWGLPLARAVADTSAVVTVGLLLLVLLLPSPTTKLTAAQSRHVLWVCAAALTWAGASCAVLVLTLSDLLALPVGDVLAGSGSLADFALNIPQGRALALSTLTALAVGTFSPALGTATAVRTTLLLSLAGLLPPVFTGHSAAAGNHDSAVVTLAVHVLAAAVWVGGLAGLLVLAVRDRPALAGAVRRFSPLALWCLIAVAASGTANAALRLESPADLLHTRYGQLVLAKAALLVLLASIGHLHRRRCLPRLGTEPAPFVRLAAVEGLLMAATLGLAVALSRSPAPATGQQLATPTERALGYAMPEPLTALRLFTALRPDAVFLLLITFATLAYLAGVRTLRRRGDRWPPGRTAAWLAGVGVLALVTQSGLATYGKVLFSVHMGQHMTLAMIVPILLVMGAPVTLALRALPATGPGGRPGARAWLLALVHSRPAKVAGHPLVAMALFISASFSVYFTPLFETGMRTHWGHLAMQLHFMGVGILFFWVIIGVDPAPRRIPHFAKFVLLVLAMPFHSFFSIALMSSKELVAGRWFAPLVRNWGPSLADDQFAAGSIAWATGDIPILITVVALAVQWMRSDRREARRIDRQIDRGDGNDPHAAYNAYLARLHARDTAARSTARDTP
ncbi:cytochrome c oxidase assembly protein [Kitasatospora cineracea]|uniref:Putative copper resistance protein D n=1 Tax=Kitasatospora cineracea TaxID=88074 RepID=A0A8G1XCB3_9ACTN|nr:cytochrome c oxidase assembly protein [Kitasatospora cineracea]ROR43011.1 putative copper resistance protein D [Kitasatospora cineracea]